MLVPQLLYWLDCRDFIIFLAQFRKLLVCIHIDLRVKIHNGPVSVIDRLKPLHFVVPHSIGLVFRNQLTANIVLIVAVMLNHHHPPHALIHHPLHLINRLYQIAGINWLPMDLRQQLNIGLPLQLRFFHLLKLLSQPVHVVIVNVHHPTLKLVLSQIVSQLSRVRRQQNLAPWFLLHHLVLCTLNHPVWI